MTVLQTQDWRTTNIHALVQLACSPSPSTYPDHVWVYPVSTAVRPVRDGLKGAYYRGEHTVSVSTLDNWCVELGGALRKAARVDPARWRCWFFPGSWLELNVQLYVVLAALGDEARAAATAEHENQDEANEDQDQADPDEAGDAVVAFEDMGVPDRLRWPAWAVPTAT